MWRKICFGNQSEKGQPFPQGCSRLPERAFFKNETPLISWSIPSLLIDSGYQNPLY
jgi:hypothetical protein